MPTRRRFLAGVAAAVLCPFLPRPTLPAPLPPPVPPPPPGPRPAAGPRFIGRSYVLEDVTMYVRRESFQIELFTAPIATLAIAPVEITVGSNCSPSWSRSPRP
jgi:hypothetical protein